MLPHKVRMRKYLEIGDARLLKESVPGLDISTAFLQRIDVGQTPESISYGNEHVERLIIRGAQPDYAAALALFSVATGRFISEFDEAHGRNVVVIGAAIADTLFPHSDPVGKQVRLDGQLYEVIGVFEKDPGTLGIGVDQFAVIPLSNYHKNFPGVRDVFLIVSVREDADLNAVSDQVVEVMRRHRRVPPHAENDFDVADSNYFLSLWNQLTGAMALLTGAIGSIGLLVGGIGVMNIMLISVTERTAEIGIRKAIGARKSDIRLQFLLEAVTLSGIGGVLGIIIGGLIAFAVRTLVSLPATLSPFWVLMGVAISVGVGLFFGYYPANRAANLDPIVCLRYE
jgi:putative ABC transport system permease protein